MAKKSCEPSSYDKHPENVQAITSREGHYVEQNTGEFNCETRSNGNYNYYGGSTVYSNRNSNTNCKPVTKKVWVNELVTRNVDLNEARRKEWIEKCAKEYCLENYDNEDCK